MRYISDRLSDKQRERLGEVVRFIIVGTTATFLQYAIYWVLIHWLNPTLSLTIGYVLSFVFNFFASTKFTFRVKSNVRHGAGFAFSHGVNYLLQMLSLNFFLWLGVSKEIAPVPVFAVCIPINFLLVRFFLKR